MSHASNNDPSLSVATLPRKAVAISFGTKLIIARYPLSNNAPPSPFNSVLIDDNQLIRAVAFLQIPDGPLCVVTAGDGKYINVYNISSWRQNNPNAVQNSSDDEYDFDIGAENQPVSVDVSSEAAHGKSPSLAMEKEDLTNSRTWTPSYRYGPHTKRITSLATCPEGTIIFADKFGEVYRLRLSWSPSHTIEVEGDATKPAVFLLQHFSVMSTIFLSAPVPRVDPIASSEECSNVACRRLFTCDKDCRIRVSRYPETYSIEQFLWTAGTERSAVTCVTEIPYPEDEAVYHSSSTANGKVVGQRNKDFTEQFSYYVTGNYKGEVHFWAARNNLSKDSSEEPFSLICTYTASTESESLGAVVAVAYITAGVDKLGNPRHPRDTPRGVLIAYEKSPNIHFVPVYDNLGMYQLHPTPIHATRTAIGSCPAAMTVSSSSSVFVLRRNGQVVFLNLSEVAHRTGEEAEKSKMCSFNANVQVAVEEMACEMPYLEERIKAATCGPAASSAPMKSPKSGKSPSLPSTSSHQDITPISTQLESLDLFSQWRYESVDPRARRQQNEDGTKTQDSAESGDSDVENSSEPTKAAAAAPQKKQRTES